MEKSRTALNRDGTFIDYPLNYPAEYADSHLIVSLVKK